MRRRWLRRRISSALLFGFLSLPAVASPPVAVKTSLLASQPKLLHLNAGDSFPFALDPAKAKHAEILLETSVPGVEFVVLDPGGHQVQAVTAEYPEWRVLALPVSASGQYSIVAKAVPAHEIVYEGFHEESSAVSVRISVLSLPPAGADARRKAETLFATAQALVHSPNAADLRQAIMNDTQAAASWAQAGEPEGQVLALASEARAWLGLSEHGKAEAALTRALSLCTPASFWHAWLTNLQAQVYLERWDDQPAKLKAEEALQSSRILHDDWLTADALADRGGSEYLKHSASARDVIRESVKLAGPLDAVGTLARAIRYSAWLEKDRGDLTRAFAQLDQVRGYFHQDGDIRSEMQAMSTLAVIAGTTGDPYASLLRHSTLAALFRKSGSTFNYALLLGDLGADYKNLNRPVDAIPYYQQALTAFRSVHHTSGEEFTLSWLCAVEKKANRLDQAMRDCQAAVALARQLNDRLRLGSAIMRLGQVQQVFGQTALAIGSFRTAATLSESVSDNRSTAEALLDLGDVLAESGKQSGTLLPLFQKALHLSGLASNIALQLEARYRIAQTEFQRGNDEDAKRELDVALASIAVQRRAVGNANLQAAFFAQVRKVHDLYVDILMSEQQPDSSARALEITESGRALTLLDTLAARDARPGTEHATAATQDLRELHLAVEEAYDQRLKLMIEGEHKAELDANAAKLTQAADALQVAEDQQKTPQKEASPAGKTLSATQIAAATANSESTLVEYMLGDTHSYVWIVDHGKIESHILPPRERIASLVKRWRDLATARTVKPGDAANDLAAQLSCTLLGDFLLPSMQHLVIVPDAELHLLPFAALPENGCATPKEPLAATRRIVLTPSLSILLSRPRISHPETYQGMVALLADPVFDRDDARVLKSKITSTGRNRPQFAPALPRLSGTQQEADAIVGLARPTHTALYSGFDANLQTLLSPALSGYRILHLATHGVFDEAVPDFSGIVLSLVDRNGQPIFGYLKAHDIEGLDLHSDLVVLSSCDSAAGVNLSGEGVRGLNHAFLSAGARRVVSTLWSVDDDPSKDLMVAFYTGMLHDGLDPAEALRRSQVMMMHNPKTAAPYFWAAFNITSTVD